MTSAPIAEAAIPTNVTEDIWTNGTDGGGTEADGGDGGGCDDGLNLACPEDLGCYSQ